jgi:cytoskeletal protein RodZ
LLKSCGEMRSAFWQGFRNGASMRIGSELKAARKKAGISVEVISTRTKIRVTKLVALEKNDFKNLPTGLYLFAAVRAYAREVHIDPEPIVERLRVEFADKDALDALHALDATGALDAKNSTDPGGSNVEQSNFLRNAAIAAGALLMAAAGAGAYLHVHGTNVGRIVHDVRGTELQETPARMEELAVTPTNVDERSSESPPPETAP